MPSEALRLFYFTLLIIIDQHNNYKSKILEEYEIKS